MGLASMLFAAIDEATGINNRSPATLPVDLQEIDGTHSTSSQEDLSKFEARETSRPAIKENTPISIYTREIDSEACLTSREIHSTLEGKETIAPKSLRFKLSVFFLCLVTVAAAME
jgi:hypothetical protein